MSQSTAVARREETATVPFVHTTKIGQILMSDEARGQIAALVPVGVNYEHVLLEVHRASIKNPDILNCTPASIIMAVGTAVQTGLVIGKTIHLVPVNEKVGNGYEKRLQAWNDYKGDMELVVWAGAARHIDAQCVYEKDEFAVRYGTSPNVDHTPAIKNRGSLIGAYAIAWLNAMGTLKKVVYLPLEEIEKVRKGSKQWNPEKVSACPYWYAEKTAIHRLCKTLPKTQRLLTVLAMLDSREQADQAELIASESSHSGSAIDDAPALSYPLRSDRDAIGDAETVELTAPAGAPVPSASPASSDAPAPASDDDLVDEVMTIETALAMPLPGGPTAWNGKGGTPLGQLSPKLIPRIHAWIGDRIKAAEAEDGDGNGPPIHYRLRNACAVILAARKVEAEKDQTTMPLDAASPAGSGESNALKPGKVEDALDTKTSAALSPRAAAPVMTKPLHELATDAARLLKNPKFAELDEYAGYKARFDKADTVEKMDLLVSDMQRFLDQPF